MESRPQGTPLDASDDERPTVMIPECIVVEAKLEDALQTEMGVVQTLHKDHTVARRPSDHRAVHGQLVSMEAMHRNARDPAL
jgi:hypothetical protein